jgi:hypothetical protein
VLVTKSETGRFKAHGLEFDIVCESTTVEAAINKLVIAVKAYVGYAITNGQLGNLVYPAPPEYWSQFDEFDEVRKIRSSPVAHNPVTLFWAMMNENRLTPTAAQIC